MILHYEYRYAVIADVFAQKAIPAVNGISNISQASQRRNGMLSSMRQLISVHISTRGMRMELYLYILPERTILQF